MRRAEAGASTVTTQHPSRQKRVSAPIARRITTANHQRAIGLIHPKAIAAKILQEKAAATVHHPEAAHTGDENEKRTDYRAVLDKWQPSIYIGV